MSRGVVQHEAKKKSSSLLVFGHRGRAVPPLSQRGHTARRHRVRSIETRPPRPIHLSPFPHPPLPGLRRMSIKKKRPGRTVHWRDVDGSALADVRCFIDEGRVDVLEDVCYYTDEGRGPPANATPRALRAQRTSRMRAELRRRQSVASQPRPHKGNGRLCSAADAIENALKLQRELKSEVVRVDGRHVPHRTVAVVLQGVADDRLAVRSEVVVVPAS